MKNKQENILIIHDVRSVQNVGAMFRTADVAGINKIYLTGYTPAPLDRFGRKRGDLAKSALGAEEFVPWEQRSLPALMRSLRREKYLIIAIEQDKKSGLFGAFWAASEIMGKIEEYKPNLQLL